ncbi:(5-formylfuran-3-yl)methyl phosphate synthase [Paraburkholderia sp. LEh10]|uniref:(5-formylfuran-3-yl)methyl phosphate synthase n=1 Tax=Paraburkholderia sp. LEh10 TaxID=2821353 RepID=UPI001AE1B591|nr:(5-formylfuran-3-yl)methyl phosphate synthase [Paraburkholderia sp. LEh10]MBP0594109.1 (5-formylfuran-3-yl)methyl phosphate synthase [Paraburkholderia sp. LEh10]
MTALLASVRSAQEALDAAGAGADLIDLKEPLDGALGGVSPDNIWRIARTLRSRYPVKPVSATIGDLPSDALDAIAARVIEVADAGVDFVKVGVTPGPDARACLARVAGLRAVVLPVLLCDEGVEASLVEYAATLGFEGIVFDTAGKTGRTLFDCIDIGTLARYLATIRASGAMACIAGSLGWPQLGGIRALAPDVAGFRTALCENGRTSRLDPRRVAQWADALHHAAPSAAA